MRPFRLISVCLLAVVVLTNSSGAGKQDLDKGIEVFLSNNLMDAVGVLKEAATSQAGNPDAHAWHAECLRRLRRFDEAADAAHRALDLDPGHAFAHTVLGDLFNPHYSMWERTDFDSTVYHLTAAVGNDPAEGNAWSALWIQAMRLGDTDLERKAAIMMIDSGFLTEPLLTYIRWQLEFLPENAILLTNGDMDTYPAVALQAKEGFRQDVAIVNLSLLNLAWYAETMAGRYDIPLPFGPDEIGSKRAYRDRHGAIVTSSKQILRGWFKMQQAGDLARPLCAAVTVADDHYTPDVEKRKVLCGPYFEILPHDAENEVDMLKLERSLRGIRTADFEGSLTSPIDRSPVRRQGTPRILTNVTAAMLRYASGLVEQEEWQEADRMLARAEEFDSKIVATGHFTEHMSTLHDQIEQHLE